MKKLYLLLLPLALSSCLKIVPLKGDYPDKPVYGYSDRQIQEVWDRLIDVVTDYGLDVKFIEKDSGLIVSEDINILSYGSPIGEITHEDRKGKVINPRAHIISERLDVSYPKRVRHNAASAKWSVVLRDAGDKTAIKVVLSNIDVHDFDFKHHYVTTRYRAYSLGNFETWLYESIK